MRRLVLLWCLFSAAVAAENCKPTRVVDGDTFHFTRDGHTVKVRVAGFDAPERGQEFGSVATKKLRELVGDGAQCACHKTDRYGRSVCRVSNSQGDVSTQMLAAGLGCIDPRYVREMSGELKAKNYAALNQAQAEKKGVWSMPQAVCGFDHRASKRQGGGHGATYRPY